MARWIKEVLHTRKRCHPKAGSHHRKRCRVESAHKGALKRMLGIPQNKKIPLALLRRAAKRPGLLGKRARLALTLRSFHHGRRR